MGIRTRTDGDDAESLGDGLLCCDVRLVVNDSGAVGELLLSLSSSSSCVGLPGLFSIRPVSLGLWLLLL